MIYSAECVIDKLKEICPDLFSDSETEQSISESKWSDLYKTLSLSTNGELHSAFEELRLKFSEHLRLGNVIFLFGNGTSMYAGSQSTMNFNISDYAKIDEFKDIEGELSNVADSVKGIEEQLNALSTIESYFHITKDKRENCTSQLISKIKHDLIENFVDSLDYRFLCFHRLMLQKLRAFCVLPKTKIYTTNYDLAFEYTMDSLGIVYKDGFTGFVNRLFDPRTLSENGMPSLIKIHGSVNWIHEENRIKAIQPEFNDGKVKVTNTDPVVIYPTSNKLYQTYATPYSELMRHMLDEMKSGSNIVVVIGYGYRDDHVNEILYKAIENPKNIFYFFTYESPYKNEFIKEMRELGRDMPNINILSGFILGSFDIFVRYIMPAGAEDIEREKIVETLREMLEQANEQDR